MKLLFILMLAVCVFAQNPSFITLQTPPPSGVQNITAIASSYGGGQNYYYWVVATYPAGKVVSLLPASIYDVFVPSVSKPVTIKWSADSAANRAGRVILGTSPSVGTVSITFTQTQPQRPVCFAYDETRPGVVMYPSAQQTRMDIYLASGFQAGDAIAYWCVLP